MVDKIGNISVGADKRGDDNVKFISLFQTKLNVD